MKRLTIGVRACTETLGLLVAVAWADGRVDDAEREGVRGAALVLNLPKELRERLESMLSDPPGADGLQLDALSERERAFAYVAGAWMARADGSVDAAEQELLDDVGGRLGLSGDRQQDLATLAESIGAPAEGARDWAAEITRLFKAIPPKLEQRSADDVEVVFE